MTGQPHITDTHTWDGTRTLPDWLHWDGHHLTLPGRDDTTPPQPGWMLVRWSDGLITVASPQVADRAFGPDGMRGRLQRAEAELADRDAAESADAAAGSYANGSEHAIADAARWLHIAFTSPVPTTANTSALAIADHLRAEFPGVGMRITTNAVEGGPGCSPNNPETEPNNPAATEATDVPASGWTQLEARAFNAVLPALRGCGQWLPLSARRAVAVAILTELRRELAALAEYENAITWHTDCLSCARVLDSRIRETERADRLADALREALARLLPVYASGNVIGYEPPLPIQAAVVDQWHATLDEPQPEPGQPKEQP